MRAVKLLRIYTGADGESHFEDVDVPLVDRGGMGRISAAWKASAVLFRETDSDYHLDWHNAPRRQLVINLDGEVEIEIGSGEKRRLGPGSILLAEDTTGRGHISRSVDGKPRRSIFVPLD